jgi:cystathionine gamma-synthase
MGAVASPFDCWLALRGLRTLHLRVQRQCQSAMLIAQFLSKHPWVQKVHYPGLDSHPQHDVASRQMQGGLYGGVLSFEVENEVFAMAVAGAVKIITRATSLGGTETLIEHRATIEPAHRIMSPRGLLRLSVGLEHVQDLIHDLDTALTVAHRVMR